MVKLEFKKGFVAVMMLVTFSACAQHATPSYASYKEGTEINLKGLNEQILYYVNQYRTSIGKSELKMIEPASAQATDHSTDMAKHTTGFGHEGFEKRINAITKQIGNITAAAENVADGKLTAKQVVDGWLHSPPHKKNIEGNYNLTGIGVAKDKDGLVYYTQIFLNK